MVRNGNNSYNKNKDTHGKGKKDMTAKTEELLTHVLQLDSTIKREEAEAALDALRGKTARNTKPEILTPYTLSEAASVIGCARRTIQNYADCGTIRRVFGPNHGKGKGKCIGYVREDVDNIARGISVAKRAA